MRGKGHLPEALIRALTKPEIENKLRSICYRLKEKGKTKDCSTDKDCTYLDFVNYGIGGIPFSKISQLFEK